MEDTIPWNATRSRRTEELDSKDAEDTMFTNEESINNKEQEEGQNRISGDESRRLLRAEAKEKERAKAVSKVHCYNCGEY